MTQITRITRWPAVLDFYLLDIVYSNSWMYTSLPTNGNEEFLGCKRQEDEAALQCGEDDEQVVHEPEVRNVSK